MPLTHTHNKNYHYCGAVNYYGVGTWYFGNDGFLAILCKYKACNFV